MLHASKGNGAARGPHTIFTTCPGICKSGLHSLAYLACTNTYLSGTFIRCQHGANSHSRFSLMHQNVVPLGGGGMCMLFGIYEKRPFQKCMGWGGGGRWSQFCAQSCKRDDTQGIGSAPEITHYSESDLLSSLPISTRAGTPFHILVHIHADAGCQKFMLGGLGRVRLLIPKLCCKSSGLRSR